MRSLVEQERSIRFNRELGGERLFFVLVWSVVTGWSSWRWMELIYFLQFW